MVEIKKILFPCDLTENSSRVLPYVLSLSEKYGGLIYLLHVVEDLSKWECFYIPHPSMHVLQKGILEGTERAVEKFCKEQMQSCLNFERLMVLGDPATEILKIIESKDIDLVVMGTHGRKGLEHTLFGSVAENVVKKSPVPVLVINPHKIK
jgi:nucleotide-binding universal stress UspA family protein